MARSFLTGINMNSNSITGLPQPTAAGQAAEYQWVLNEIAAAGSGESGGTVTSVGLALPSIFLVSGSPVTGSGTLTGTLTEQAANQFFAGPASGDAAAPAFRALTAADLPAGTGTVTSVGLALPSIFTVTDAEVTTSGTLTATLAAENPNLVFAGPASGDAAAPTFRALATADLPAGTGTVTEVGLALPSIFDVTVAEVTTSGTLTATLVSQAENTFFAAPSGAAGAPSFRALASADLPAALTPTSIVVGSPTGGNEGPGSINAAAIYVNGDPVGIGNGSVTSVGLSLPSIFTVTGSPVTAAGTLTGTLASQSENLVFASPSGSAGTPSFRALTTADLPAGVGSVTSVDFSLPNIFTVTGSPITGSGTLTATLASQAENTFFAAPSGAAGTPSFRALVTADLPAGTGTVTSVALSLPSIFTVTGSPITTNGTLTAALASQAENAFFAAPSGAAGAPSFRTIAGADLPLSSIAGTGLSVSGGELVVTNPYNPADVAITGGTIAGVTLNNSAIGNVTPAAGSFTTLSASSGISGAGFVALFEAPPAAIGSVTPVAGSFTTLSASSTVSGAGFTALFEAPPAIGSVTPNTGAFTTLTATNGSAIEVTPTGATAARQLAAILGDLLTAKDAGCTGNGTTDDTADMTTFLEAVAAGTPGFLPGGRYVISSQISVTVSSKTSFSLFGAGLDVSNFVFTTNGGIKITLQDQNSSVHIHDLSFLAEVANEGTGLTLIQSASVTVPYAAPSDLVNLSFHDAAGNSPATNYFATGISITGMSQISFDNVTIQGATGASYATAGVGVSISGSSTTIPTVFNFENCTFNLLEYGLEYGAYIQGVALDNCNFTGCAWGIYATGAGLDQLVVTNSQFNVSTNCIGIASLLNLQAVNNLFYVPAAGNGIALDAEAGQTVITGNAFYGLGTKAGTGIAIADATSGTVISDNVIGNLNVGVELSNGSTYVSLFDNVYLNNNYNYQNNNSPLPGTGNLIGNMGFPTQQSANRVLGTLYYNENERPMSVSVQIEGGATGYVSAAVQALEVGAAYIPSADVAGSLTFVVPPGCSYSVSGTATGTNTIQSWVETV
jgi:hypothetical protein